MDALAQYSMLAMVTAAVVYLFALFAHAAEWAAARNAGEVVTKSRTRVPVLVGGLPAADTIEPPESDTTAELPDEPESDKVRTNLFWRIGVALTMVALLSQIVAVVLRGLAAERLPWGNMYEFTSSSLVVVVAVYLVLAIKFEQRWLGLPVAMLSTIGLGLAVTVFYVDVAPLVPSLHSAWFLFHILAAVVAGAAFTLGGISAILYLLRRRAEESGVVRGYLSKVPSSDKLDRFTYVTSAFAFPLFTFVIAAGSIWAQYAWGRYWGWDPKETWSLVTWAIYAAYLHARSTAGWKGKPAAIIAVIGAVSFWWNFVGINLLVAGLHSYAK
ncbi:MAG TPA: c-type cytochrome biogenesis protein CcsB [Propionibacterium sp.]|jgi:cytochrome c-type biogenesis protein CcsB|nr:c-type cytochrome biogenesis protein CcsB [Propionibacterium sp.]